LFFVSVEPGLAGAPLELRKGGLPWPAGGGVQTEKQATKVSSSVHDFPGFAPVSEFDFGGRVIFPFTGAGLEPGTKEKGGDLLRPFRGSFWRKT
jgi:hypothetical protein